MSKQNKSPPEEVPGTHHRTFSERHGDAAFLGSVLVAAGLMFYGGEQVAKHAAAEAKADVQRMVEYDRTHPERPSLPCQPWAPCPSAP